MNSYNFNQHKHLFAVWTAARASQRGFTTTLNIKQAIEHSTLQQFSESCEEISKEDYETFHRQCCYQLINNLNEFSNKIVNYGRVAKIISVYLKTSVIIPNKG